MAFFSSATRQASHTPSSSKAMVVFLLSGVWENSGAELGRWFEMTHVRQNLTWDGNP